MSAIETIALTFAGTSIQDMEGLFLQITAGLSDSPTVRGVDVLIPKADGQTSRPRRFHERRIMLEGFVRGSGSTYDDQLADYRANIRSMLSLFDATLPPDTLQATLEDGSIATIECRTLSVLTPEDVRTYATVSIEMLAVEDWVVAGS
jgi:hypothetical protein